MIKKCCFFLIFIWSFSLSGQRINTTFGKNRVQYHKDYDEWRKYNSEHFTSYWYGKAKIIANTAVDIAEEEYEEIRQLMEYKLHDRIELLIFTDITDLKQSNIGSEEVFEGKVGETSVIDNKIFVYFDGDHNHLHRSIREGIAAVFLNKMLIGSGLKEMIKIKLMLHVPYWFKGGLISYVGCSWDVETDIAFSNIVESLEEDKWNFSALAHKYPKIIGHSFWNFIDRNYGKSAISNILYLTRIYKSINEAFLFELGLSQEELEEEWLQFYINNYKNPTVDSEVKPTNILYKSGKNEIITKIKLNKLGDKMLICKNKHGKTRIVLLDLKSGKRKTLFKEGYKNLLQKTDYNYPLVTWESNDAISVIYEHRDVLYFRNIDINTGDKVEQILPGSIQRIYSLSKINKYEYVIAGNVNGNSDIFIYNAKKRQAKALTSDSFDDLDAVYIKDNIREGVFFSSNRKENNEEFIISGKEKFGLFYIDFLNNNKISKLLSNNSSSIRNSQKSGNGIYSYLSDKTGYWQQYILKDNLEKPSLVTSSGNNIEGFCCNAAKGKTYTIRKEGKRSIIRAEQFNWESKEEKWSNYKQSLIDNNSEKGEQTIHKIPEGYQFVTKFMDPNEQPYFEVKGEKISEGKKHQFRIDNISGARLEFRLDDYSITFNNDLLFEGLETYIEDQNEFQFADNKGFLFKASVVDMFENYKIEAGLRLPTRLDGNEVYIVASDNKRLIDREYILYRKSKKYTQFDNNLSGFQKSKRISVLGMFRLKYPFDVYNSLRLSTSYRIDKFVQLGVDNREYDNPIVNDKRVAIKLEYIFDNTVEKDVNILHGTRYKIYVEAINKFDIQLFDNPSFDLNNGHTFVFGIDARNYFPIGEHALIASRFSAFSSFGSEKILFQLGGVENWLNPSFSENATNLEGGKFSYKYNVANLRGFNFNVRNGNSVALASVEFRISPFKYLTKKRIKSSFFRNFQFNFFYDIGTAWHGISPFDDNPLNQVHIKQPPLIELDITYYRDPIIMGYGVGIRTTILGTLIRADYGWGIESGLVQEPIVYLSMGYDF